MAEKEERHVWQAGDLCAYRRGTHDMKHTAVIYRVIDVEDFGGHTKLWIKPVFGFLDSLYSEHTHDCNAEKMVPMTVVALGTERARFDDFLQQEARRHGK